MNIEKHEAGVKCVINDIIKDKFIGKAERILKFIKDSGYKLPSETE